ncbi:hypothetical protein CONLIGDRAFT_635928 [Coniochaeta ligniaria NRRL 30616]|uniref:PPP4R2-domain-containing protein n=1 Tax=Coniochaeta ligniaria NRRL 30616 TaxID=1408157 RepID=A0A1J7JAD8_9PEZI|nr:hypothetical protein CONLIGDRAFT_635928 [Coniochaeta ligniaria NRRL 30616]
MDFQSWETLLPGLIARIEKIAHTEFPVPNIPTPATRTPAPRFLMPIPSSDPIAPTESTPSSQETDKENALPPSSVGVTSAPSSSRPFPPLTQLIQPPIPLGTLPGPIALLLDEVTSTLMDNFGRFPPHTIQRLAELVLEPKRHYRSLTAYLHALDRIVHVTSGNNIYPLPPAVPDMSQMSLLANGVGASGLQIDTATANSLGSDESLGGALLTPIPWLARRANGGSEDGAGSSEDGSGSSPISAHGQTPAASTGGQQPAPQPQPQQPAAQTPQPQPQPQAQPSPTPAPESTTPPTHAQVRTESTETIEGPNGMGSIETVSVSVNGVPSTGAVLASRGVTQGELLRQEQRAGVVPLSQLVRQAQQQQQQQQQAQAQAQGGAGSSTTSNATNDAEAEEERVSNSSAAAESDAAMDGEEEAPHARGPSEIDHVDTGPQAGSGGATHLAVGSTSASGQPVVNMQGIDIEAAVGRKADAGHQASAEEERKTSPEKGEEIVPRSPKREAEDGLEGEAEAKKVKLGEDAGQKEEEGDAMKVDKPTEDAPAGIEEGAKPETDTEGDVVIKDPVPADGEADEAAAGGDAGKGV